MQWSECGLSKVQGLRLGEWLPGAGVVTDYSWGIVPTRVLQVRQNHRHYIVKAAPPQDRHLTREIAAHQGPLAELVRLGKAPMLVHHDVMAAVLVTEYVPGVLVLDSPAVADADVYRQAGELLAVLHGAGSRTEVGYEQRLVSKTLGLLDGDHRIDPAAQQALREWLSAWPAAPTTTIVPTHGDYQPRNWVIDDGEVFVIDFGRFEWRTPDEDMTRLAVQEFVGHPERAEAFTAGYGADLQRTRTWPLVQVQAAVSTAVWAYQVGEEAFERQGHVMIASALGQHTLP